MIIKILKKEFSRKKAMLVTLFIFIFLSTLFASSGTNLIIKLSTSINYFFKEAKTPHFVQMHSGNIDYEKINTWAKNNQYVYENQIVDMININSLDIKLPNNISMQKYNIIDNSFVKQNNLFDILLNLENKKIIVSKGEIAVPIYYMQKENLKIGDKIKIINKNFQKEFIIIDFVRDSQMNPSIVHSKRFVINDSDFEDIKANIGLIEYLIEFRLKDLNDLSKFSHDYQISALPQKGPTIDYNLFQILNGITSGIIAITIIFSGILINLIAILCLRFSIITTMEEDYRELGIMKAIGFPKNKIRDIYLSKYTVISFFSCFIAYLFSMGINKIYEPSIILYTGKAPKSILEIFIPFISTILIFLIILFSSIITIRKFNKVSVIDSLNAGIINKFKKNKYFISLENLKFLNINIFLGIKDIFTNFKIYQILFFIFFISSFLIIVPFNLLNTMKSQDFIQYMGVSKSDIRIDLQQAEDLNTKLEYITDYLNKDKDVKKSSTFITSNFEFLNNEGNIEKISIETGDFSLFPLNYIKGRAPENHHEMALSYLNSKDLDKNIGDNINLVINGNKKSMKISGIYQDITNGGKTAKALIPHNENSILWSIINLDVNTDININDKIEEYNNHFETTKITDLDQYLIYTLGETISQFEFLTIFIIIISTCISVLITTLFLNMLIIKEKRETILLKTLGFNFNNIKLQYVTKITFILILGITLGSIASNTLGENIISILWSFMGAPNIQFIISPIYIYIVYPLGLMCIIYIIILINIQSIKSFKINEINIE